MALKENLGDLVIEKLHKRRELVRAKLAERYKGVKPLRMTRATKDEVMAQFNTLPLEERIKMLTELGGK